MKHEPNGGNASGKLNEGSLLICPMCKGRGYFEPTQAPHKKEVEPIQNDELETHVKLPQLRHNEHKEQGPKSKANSKYVLPSINNVKNLPEQRPAVWSGFYETRSEVPEPKQCKEKADILGVGRNVHNLKTKLVSSQRLSVGSSTDSIDEKSLIPSPKHPINPIETLKSSLIKLKGSNWNESVNALRDIVQLSRFEPDLLEPSMVFVYRGLINLLKSFRSVVVRTACQATNELFTTMGFTQRPEFDEVVTCLLQKTSDTNKVVRQDANEALDTMVVNISPNHSIRAIVNKGVNHKSPLVRAASARLLVCTVGVIGVDNVFSGNKETRSRIISAGATFMQDGNQEVRSFGKKTMKMLMRHDDYEEVLKSEVPEVILKRIEKSLITMKYKS